MVACVRQDHAILQAASQGRECGPVGHVAGGEEEGGFFVVQVGQFRLKKQVVVVGAGADRRGEPHERAVGHPRGAWPVPL